MDYAQHKAMLAALEAGTATPEQQQAACAYLIAVKRQHAIDLRDADGFHEPRRGDYGPGMY